MLLLFIVASSAYAFFPTQIHKITDSMFAKPTPITTPTPTYVPTPLPTEIPTNTPIPQEQTYQQPIQQQAPSEVNCNVTAYVPNHAPTYATFTPDQCSYEQAYAVTLWNKTVGADQQIRIPQQPQNYYTYPSGNTYVAPLPTEEQTPQLQAPAAPNGNVNYQVTVPTPTKTCYVIWQGGVQVPVCN